MIVICGRNVKVATGQKSQTINICTEENINGKYEYKIRLRPPFINQTELTKLQVQTIHELAEYLKKNYDGILEIGPPSLEKPITQNIKITPNDKSKRYIEQSGLASSKISKIPDWNGNEVDIAISRGGVKAISNPYSNLISAGINPWPPPEILQKLYKSNQGRAYTGIDSNQSTSFLGYYSDLQSLHSEDAITWSVFGPLIYSDSKIKKTWCLDLLGQLGIMVSNTEAVKIWLWRRIPHPDTLVSGGPEIDFGIITEKLVVFGECKWRSGIGQAQGKNKNKDQITLRKEFFKKYGNIIFPDKKYFTVLGVSLSGDIFEETKDELESSSILFNRNITWKSLCGIKSHPCKDELERYLNWKIQNSKF